MTNKKELIEKIRIQLSEIMSEKEVKFTQHKVGDLTIETEDDEIKIGSEVFIKDEDGANVQSEDGSYTLDSGVKIEVVAGKVTSISKVEAEVEAEVEANEDKEDEDKKEVEMEEDKKVEMEVLKDGSYTLDSGIKLVVEEGKAYLEAEEDNKEDEDKEDNKEVEDKEVKLSAIIVNFSETIKKLEERVEKLSSEPSDNKIEKKETTFSSEKEDNSKVNVDRLLEGIRSKSKK